ncbi:MAG: TetR/AcrR family transcriptional regulator [Lysobacterales bacterium]
MNTGHDALDPRKRRTRDALLQAFFGLVLQRRYHEIRIADVLAQAGVSRSTFYEHFSSKDALLAASIEGPFSILTSLLGEHSLPRVQALLEHFWLNRGLARTLFQGAGIRPVRATLVAAVEKRLKRDHGPRLRVPPRLAAHAIAEAMLSPIVAWLNGEAACSASDLAQALQATTAAILEAMSAGGRTL